MWRRWGRVFQPMVADERGRDVPVVRELRWPPGPVALLRKRPALPMLAHNIAFSYWVGAVYIAVKAGIITLVWLKVATGAAGSGGIVVQGTGVLLLMGLWPVPVLALLGWGLWTWRGRRNAARFMASRGACPSCGSSLLGLSEREDGYVVCGTCLSAWKVGSPEVCPGCAYDLLGTGSDADGVLTCPECGLAFPGASSERRRHDAVLLRGGMDDDAGLRVAKRHDAKRRRVSINARSRKEVERAQLPLFLLAMVGVAVVLLVPPFIGAPVENMARRVMSDRAAGFVLGATIMSIWSGCGIVLYLKIREAYAVGSCRLGICPACDADLRGVAVGEDGLTPCPNCDARWSLPPQPID